MNECCFGLVKSNSVGQTFSWVVTRANNNDNPEAKEKHTEVNKTGNGKNYKSNIKNKDRDETCNSK